MFYVFMQRNMLTCTCYQKERHREHKEQYFTVNRKKDTHVCVLFESSARRIGVEAKERALFGHKGHGNEIGPASLSRTDRAKPDVVPCHVMSESSEQIRVKEWVFTCPCEVGLSSRRVAFKEGNYIV